MGGQQYRGYRKGQGLGKYTTSQRMVGSRDLHNQPVDRVLLHENRSGGHVMGSGRRAWRLEPLGCLGKRNTLRRGIPNSKRLW